LKKLLVILLVVICAFNGFGYRLLVSWLEDRADTRLEIALDKGEYNPLDEIVVMAAITHLSYYNSSFEFDRQHGEIDIDGASYRFIKMRLHGDSVEVVCIPNYPARKSLAIQEHFIKWNFDNQQTNQGKKSGNHYGSFKILVTEFDAAGRQPMQAIPYSLISKKIFHFLSETSSLSSPVIENPPEYFC